MFRMETFHGFIFVLCFLTIILVSGQPTQETDQQHCDVVVSSKGELQQLKRDVTLLTNLLVGVSEKLTKLDEIEEKLVKLDQIEEKLTKLDEIAENTYVPNDYKTGYRVHHFSHPLGYYRYSLSEATERCIEEGMTIATPQQLQVAWKEGMNVCACGWLSDGSRRYPIQYPQPGCGGTFSGLTSCGQSVNDVYCYK